MCKAASHMAASHMAVQFVSQKTRINRWAPLNCVFVDVNIGVSTYFFVITNSQSI